VPSDFDPAESGRFEEATRRCVSARYEPIEVVSETSFRFGRDIRNGREVAFDFACSTDKCQIASRVVYVDLESRLECICLGGIRPVPAFEMQGDERCHVHRRFGTADYSVEVKPSSNGPELRVMVSGDVLLNRLRPLGFGQFDVVVSIDGADPKKRDIEQILERRPGSLPRVVRFGGHDAPVSGIRSRAGRADRRLLRRSRYAVDDQRGPGQWRSRARLRGLDPPAARSGPVAECESEQDRIAQVAHFRST
jgi:hypothetical protein